MNVKWLFSRLKQLIRPRAVSSVSVGDKSNFGTVQTLIRRRHPRVTLLALHAASFELWPDGSVEAADKARNVLSVGLSNLSISGMGVFTKDLRRKFKTNDLIEGMLRCGNEEVRVTAQVMYFGDAIAGCQFVGHDIEVNRLVQNYFKLELAALGMISVNPEMLQDDPDGVPHWVHGKNNCEVFFISNGDRVLRYNMTFFGNYIEGAEGKRPKYGQIVDEEDSLGKPRHKGAALICWDPNLASSMEVYAQRFLRSVPHLSEPHRRALIELLGIAK